MTTGNHMTSEEIVKWSCGNIHEHHYVMIGLTTDVLDLFTFE